MKKMVLLVFISRPRTIARTRELLDWPKFRAPTRDQPAVINKEGLLCEIDADDLEEARSFGEVEVIGGKEVDYDGEDARPDRQPADEEA